jgi:hypothetical protein
VTGASASDPTTEECITSVGMPLNREIDQQQLIDLSQITMQGSIDKNPKAETAGFEPTVAHSYCSTKNIRDNLREFADCSLQRRS